MSDLDITVVEQRDPRLGRQRVHDPASRGFARGAVVDTSKWATRSVRIWDPRVNPNQEVGNCTGCAKSMQFNASGNRVTGRVLRMSDADKLYSWASRNDPWPGEWPPTDTGSSGLASAKAGQALGYGGSYRWFFGGADEIVQHLQGDRRLPDGRVVPPIPVSVGTWWLYGMFDLRRRAGAPASELGWVVPTGGRAGGHQYVLRGYVEPLDALVCRCWWGPEFRDWLIKREHLNELVLDDGDAHVQERVAT